MGSCQFNFETITVNLRAACINYFSYYLRLVFEGGLYLKAASIRENTVYYFIFKRVINENTVL